MRPISTAVIGLSGFATTHLKAIAAHPEALSLDAVVVRLPRDERFDEERREHELSQRGVRIYRTYRELYRAERGRIQLVTIPCGIPDHAELSIEALESGYDVLCEKPAAGNLEDALRMRDSHRRTGKTLMIGFQHLLRPSVQYLKETALSGRLGRLVSARTLVSWPRDPGYYARNGWAGRLTVNGKGVYDSPLQNAAAHFFQNMLYVAGSTPNECAEPKEVYAENYHAARIESADTQFVRVRTDSDAMLVLVASHAATRTLEPVTEFFFERGRIRWEISGHTELFEGSDQSEAVETHNDGVDDPHDLPFLEAAGCSQGHEPRSTIENAIQHSRCVDAAFRSSGQIGSIDLEALPPDYDLARALEESYDTARSFFDLGLDWAGVGRVVTL